MICLFKHAFNQKSCLHIPAQIAKADIALKYQYDKDAFIKYYSDLSLWKKNSKTFELLGDAYMTIQSPQNAIYAYENALQLNATDMELARKIGKALVATHDYQKATNYYEKALNEMPENYQIRNDIVKMYIKLGQFNAAKIIIQTSLKHIQMRSASESQTDVAEVGALIMLAEIYENEGKNADELKEVLLKAKDNQINIISRTSGLREVEKEHDAHRLRASILWCKLGDIAESSNKIKDAIASFEEALHHSPTNQSTMLSLTRAQFLMKNGDKSHKLCEMVLWNNVTK